MSPTETLQKPTETDIHIPAQRDAENLYDMSESDRERAALPEPGLGDFDLERGRAGLTNFARLTGHIALGPRIPLRRR